MLQTLMSVHLTLVSMGSAMTRSMGTNVSVMLGGLESTVTQVSHHLLFFIILLQN